jgi:hypothetical protein
LDLISKNIGLAPTKNDGNNESEDVIDQFFSGASADITNIHQLQYPFRLNQPLLMAHGVML